MDFKPFNYNAPKLDKRLMDMHRKKEFVNMDSAFNTFHEKAVLGGIVAITIWLVTIGLVIFGAVAAFHYVSENGLRGVGSWIMDGNTNRVEEVQTQNY